MLGQRFARVRRSASTFRAQQCVHEHSILLTAQQYVIQCDIAAVCSWERNSRAEGVADDEFARSTTPSTLEHAPIGSQGWHLADHHLSAGERPTLSTATDRLQTQPSAW